MGVVGLAQPAASAEPARHDSSVTSSTVATDICSFPVTVESTATGAQTFCYDQDGDLRRVENHGVFQDVSTANGKALVGLPYSYNVEILLDARSGAVAQIYANGIVERVPLPGGSFFVTTGRIDATAHTNVLVIIQPDADAQGSLKAFCGHWVP